jgi:hypothetical protein
MGEELISAPDRSSAHFTARIEREVRSLDEPTLRWGNEKILFVAKHPIGAATQRFVIDVR